MADDSKAKAPAVDLLGDPWTPPRDPRGRKRHRRNPQVAQKIALMRSTGSTVEDVVLNIGLSAPTLRKYYLRELDEGSTLARQEILQAQYQRAMAGSAASAKLVLAEIERNGFVPRIADAAAQAAAAASPSNKPLGKKEQATLDAQSAGLETEWGADLRSRSIQ